MVLDNFKFGFSECGFQSEMGLSDIDYNSDWFIWSNDKRNIQKHYVSGDLPQNGVAYWDLYKQDHDNADKLNINSARLGIEWSRIFPVSTENIKVNVKYDNDDILYIGIDDEAIKKMDKISDKNAIKHYMDMINDFKSRNQFLIINFYHWTIPKWLNDPSNFTDNDKQRAIGGCFNNRIIIEFAKYCAYIANKFDYVADRWSTMNEPNMVYQGCSVDNSYNGISMRKKKFAEAHARAYDAIKSFSKKPVGVIFANGDIQSIDNDVDIVNKAKFFNRYSFFDSIINGDLSWYYELINDGKSMKIRDDMKNRVDWLGLNYYSRDVIKRSNSGWDILKGYGHYCGDMKKSLDNRSVSETGWEIYPDGIYNIIMDYYRRYKIPVTITENGIADDMDKYRSNYIISHFYNVEKAINDGAEVEGYYHWSLTDNYEWASGFSKNFGLFKVNMETKERLMRPSAIIYKKIIDNYGVPENLKWIAENKI